MADTVGLATAELHYWIPDTSSWWLWWICLLLALWPSSDPSYWETSVSAWPRLSHTLVRVHSSLGLSACHAINTNWPFFMVTNIFHMFLASSQIILNLRGHNKSTQRLVLGVKNHRILCLGYLLTWFVKRWKPQDRLQQRVALCVRWVETDLLQPRLMVPLLCLQPSQQGSV